MGRRDRARPDHVGALTAFCSARRMTGDRQEHSVTHLIRHPQAAPPRSFFSVGMKKKTPPRWRAREVRSDLMKRGTPALSSGRLLLTKSPAKNNPVTFARPT